MAIVCQLQTHLALPCFEMLELVVYKPHFCFVRGSPKGNFGGDCKAEGRGRTCFLWAAFWLLPVGFLFEVPFSITPAMLLHPVSGFFPGKQPNATFLALAEPPYPVSERSGSA